MSVDGHDTVAFVPEELPPDLLEEGDYIDEVGQAMRALGQPETEKRPYRRPTPGSRYRHVYLPRS